MNIDKSNSATNTILQTADMARSASSLQAKSWGNSSSSFASQMKNSVKEQETEQVKEQSKVEETDKNSETGKSEKTNSKTSAKKSDTKSAENAQKEQSTQSKQTLEGEVSASDEANAYQNPQQQGQNGQSQKNSYNSLSDQIQAYMNANGVSVNFSNFNPMSATSRSQLTGMGASVDYSAIQMSSEEAKFFSDLVSRTDMSATGVANEFEKALQQGNTQAVQSTAKSTLALIEALKESSKTNQPFRIDFDKDVSVVLQVDREGKINANFIPGDQAVENYLRNNIGFLRQRFDEENIAYGDLNYSKRRGREEQEKRNNKESGHE